MLVSVIIPVYQVEAYINRCVDSVLNQKYRELEVILVDDGSPDRCGAICDEYALKDNRIVVIHKKNGGLSSARNAALDICKGEYIMFVDSDDYVEPDFCESAMSVVEHDQVLCASFGYFEHLNSKITTFCTRNPRVVSSQEAINSLIVSNDVIFNLTWNKIYHKSLFENLRFPIGKHFEDQGTTYKLIDLAGKIYVSSAVSYHYVRRGDSITQSDSVYTVESPKNINDLFDLWYERLLFLKEKYPDLVSVEYEQLTKHVLRGMRVLPWQENKELINKFRSFLDENENEVKALHLGSRALKCYYSCFPLFCLGLVVYRWMYK
jgi:glycosyltransferase involved in cell wall biosynthesis